MRCHNCQVEKVRHEFPRETLSSNCEHAALHCFRCSISAAKQTGLCPQCGEQVDHQILEEFESEVAHLFPDIEEFDDLDIDESSGEVIVSTLDGELMMFPYTASLTVFSLKKQIYEKTGVLMDYQKLVFQDISLETYDESGDFMVLSDYKITAGTTLHLMILLLAIPENLDKVIFDLSWGYPASGEDFLDASCFIFSNNNHLGTVNYNERSWPVFAPFIQHSGDGMDDTAKRGYHTIDIFLKKLPQDVTHLFFTLSVWRSQSISHFRMPILRFYDALNESKDLCNTSIQQSSDSEAVIMCNVMRNKQKTSGIGWEICESGHLTAGNVMNLDPLIQTMKTIISRRGYTKQPRGKVRVAPVAAISSKSLSHSVSKPRPVEVAISFDTTASMYTCLEEVRKNVQEFITQLLNDVPNLRIAVFAHGDYGSRHETYVTKYVDFTNNKRKLCEFVNSVERTYGHDRDECYEFVLYEVRTKLSWSGSANKSLIMIGDSTPHPKNNPQNTLRLDWEDQARKLFSGKGVRIYSVQCMDRSYANHFWKQLSVLGHGKLMKLNNFKDIVDLLLAICYREGAPKLLQKLESDIRSRGAMSSSMMDMFSTLRH